MTAIDLSRDLELWVDFDSEYWDAQRNQIQDQSGYGRHPVASGGPTVGVEGPNDFEAASFDGVDDRFQSNASGINPSGQTEATLVSMAKVENEVVQELIWLGNTDFLLSYSGDSPQVVATNASDSLSNVTSAQDLRDEFVIIIGEFDEGELRLRVNGVLEGSMDIGLSELSNSKDKLAIGDGVDGGGVNPFDGDIAMAGYWRRTLSDAEIEYLNNLTAPRRSQL